MPPTRIPLRPLPAEQVATVRSAIATHRHLIAELDGDGAVVRAGLIGDLAALERALDAPAGSPTPTTHLALPVARALVETLTLVRAQLEPALSALVDDLREAARERGAAWADPVPLGEAAAQ